MTEPHPLFPTENDDDEPVEVGFIHVTRHEAGGQRWAPPLYAANDLTSLEDVTNRYGGGTYELIARSLDKKRITGRRRYSLPGRPLPLDDAPPEAQQAQPHAPSAGIPQSSSDTLLVAVLNMMQAQQQQNTQLLVAMLTRGEASSKEHIQSMTALHDRFANGQSELFKAMLEAKSGGGGGEPGGVDTFLKGLEFAQEMQQGIREAQEEGGGDSDLKELIEGFKTFYAMKMQEDAVRNGRPPVPPPNGAG